MPAASTWLRASALAWLVCAESASAHRLTECMEEAGRRHGIHPVYLWAIAKQESGFRPTALNRNTNGSVDMGMMQINDRWLPTLARYGISREQVMEPCNNIKIGAWILAQNIRRYGYNWRAIGAYNAVSRDKQVRYARNVLRHVDNVAAQQRRSTPPVSYE